MGVLGGGSKRQKTGWGVDDNSVERKVLQRVNDRKKRGRHGEIQEKEIKAKIVIKHWKGKQLVG